MVFQLGIMKCVSLSGLENGSYVSTGVAMDSIQQRMPDIHPNKLAVEIKGAVKRFGKMTVLNQLNMQVEEGTIYSLLGASGCGKTTALSCVIGLTKLDSGSVFIFGEKPGSPKSGVPGNRVGYMPQDIALNRELTMKEVLHYFGKIYGMLYEEVEERRKFFLEFLNLKTVSSNPLGIWSGGQRRRISFAVALLHQAEILILDEPTIGVDPLLRQRMWQHLLELKEKQTTIIITTHYIEETKLADRIGLMRNGRLIMEESPQILLHVFNTTSMEEILLKLCLRDSAAMDKTELEKIEGILLELEAKKAETKGMPIPVNVINSKRQMRSRKLSTKWGESLQTHRMDRLQALFKKNLIVAYRGIWFWIFLLLMPAINVYLICVCLVAQPRDLRFGIVNHEMPVRSECEDVRDICIIANFSCRFIQELSSKTFILVDYTSDAEALAAVVSGNTYGYMSIPHKFTDNIYDRFASREVDQLKQNETIIGSQIHFGLDMSNNEVGLGLQFHFYDAFRRFSRTLQTSCGENPDATDTPLIFDKPVYGVEDVYTKIFVVPGAAITFVSFLASLISGLAFIIEKNEGMLQRGRVAGVTHVEIMLSHLFIHFVVLQVQAVFVFLVMFLAFNIPSLGSIPLAYAITVLNGVTGMSMGFLAASVCDKERNAMLIAIGAIIPTLLVSGTLSPFEALPALVKYIGYVYPGTFPEFALKAILLKGFTMGDFTVYMGFITAIGWSIFYWFIIIFYHSDNT